jgi:hypothetical protein
METITVTADRATIEDARRAAEAENRTLDEVVGELLAKYAAGAERVRRFDAVLDQMKGIKTGGPFSREEMNERR